MKTIEIAQIPPKFATFEVAYNFEDLKIFQIANAPYYEEGFLYSPSCREMRDFILGFKTEGLELFGFFDAAGPSLTAQLKKIGCPFAESGDQVRICFTCTGVLVDVLKDVWDFEKEHGQAVFILTASNNHNLLLDTSKTISPADLLQLSSVIFNRGHDCAYMEIYSRGMTLAEIITILKKSVAWQGFEIRHIDNYFDTDWVKSWKEK